MRFAQFLVNANTADEHFVRINADQVRAIHEVRGNPGASVVVMDASLKYVIALSVKEVIDKLNAA